MSLGAVKCKLDTSQGDKSCMIFLPWSKQEDDENKTKSCALADSSKPDDTDLDRPDFIESYHLSLMMNNFIGYTPKSKIKIFKLVSTMEYIEGSRYRNSRYPLPVFMNVLLWNAILLTPGITKKIRH